MASSVSAASSVIARCTPSTEGASVSAAGPDASRPTLVDALVADLVSAVSALAAERERVLVGVDGPDAAGKTTLADRLATASPLHVVRAGLDGFHYPRAHRQRRGELSSAGYYHDAFDVDALVDGLLAPFPHGAKEVTRSVFDHRTDCEAPARVRDIPARSVLVVDGVFLLRPALRRWWTLTVYLYVPAEETLRRALARDRALFGSEAEVRRRYRQRYLPGRELYRQESQPQAHANIVIDNSEPAAPRVLRWSLPSSADATGDS